MSSFSIGVIDERGVDWHRWCIMIANKSLYDNMKIVCTKCGFEFRPEILNAGECPECGNAYWWEPRKQFIPEKGRTSYFVTWEEQ